MFARCQANLSDSCLIPIIPAFTKLRTFEQVCVGFQVYMGMGEPIHNVH